MIYVDIATFKVTSETMVHVSMCALAGGADYLGGEMSDGGWSVSFAFPDEDIAKTCVEMILSNVKNPDTLVVRFRDDGPIPFLAELLALGEAESAVEPDTVATVALYEIIFDDEDGVGLNIKKTYAWTRSVAEVVVKDYGERFGPCRCRVAPAKAADASCDYYIDLGGMIFTDCPNAHVTATHGLFNGRIFPFSKPFTLSMPIHHTDRVLAQLRGEYWSAADVERAASQQRGYMKLHGKWSCVALPLDLAEALATELAARLGSFYEIEKAFMDSKKAEQEARGPVPSMTDVTSSFNGGES